MKNRILLIAMVFVFMLALSSLFSLEINPFNYGIAAQDGATGRGFIMYSAESVHTRFAQNKPLSSNADHFICVKFDGTTWKYDNNTAYFTFTPRTTDILVAEVSFTNDEVISTEGVYDNFEGITYGYASGDLFIEPNIWAGAANSGEFKLNGTHINTNYYSVGDMKEGIAGYPAETGTGYILYSEENLYTRFPDEMDAYPYTAEHFISVKFRNNQWYFNTRYGSYPFTPVESDILVAAVDFDIDSIKSLERDVSIVNGVMAGYLSGDLEFKSNELFSAFILGFFNLRGTYFVPMPKVTANHSGVACQDGATGSGYIMYSAESVFIRFSDHQPYYQNAHHFIGIKYINDQWYYDNNGSYYPFTPRETDVLIAYVDYTNDSVATLEGQVLEYNGIRRGYKSGNINVIANQFNGAYNKGEFYITGDLLAPAFPYESTLFAPPKSLDIKAPKSNTQIKLPNNLYLADVDGDTNTDFIQTAGNRMFMYRTNLENTGISHIYIGNNIVNVFAGDFKGLGYEQIVALDDTHFLRYLCKNYNDFDYVIKNSQYSFIDSSDVVVVGDYDGDRKDEIFLYDPINASCKMYDFNNLLNYFEIAGNFDMSGLNDLLITDLQFRAGDFNGDDRTDLAFITSSGQVRLFHSQKTSNKFNFKSMFTTTAGVVAADEEISVARIDDNNTDDIAIYQTTTGNVDFYEAKYDNQMLKTLNNVDQGQFPKLSNSNLFWVWNKNHRIETGYRRNDVLVYSNNTNKFRAAHARWSGSAYTYWYWYYHSSPDYHIGWPETVRKNWVIVKGKMGNDNLFADSKLDDLYYGAEGGYQQLKDITFGTLIPEFTINQEWHDMTVDYDDYTNLTSGVKINKVLDVAKANGVDISPYRGALVMTNHEKGANYRSGNILFGLDNMKDVSYLAHEILHAFRIKDSYSDVGDEQLPSGKYCDQWDVMSARHIRTFPNTEGITAGMGLNVPNLLRKDWIPANRIYDIDVSNGQTSVDINISPLNQPEVKGYLAAKIKVAPDVYFTLEYRRPTGWDRPIPNDCIVVHQFYDDNRAIYSILKEKHDGPDYTPGETYKNPWADEGFSVDILSFDDVEGYATVRINIE